MSKISIKKRIIITFGCIIFITVGILTIIAWNLQKEQYLFMAEAQLQDAAGNVIEKMSVMQALLDSRQFDSKLGYYLGNQRTKFLQRGYHLSQYVVSKNGKEVKTYGYTKTIPFSQNEIINMVKKERGILHIKTADQIYTAAYEYSLETQTLIVLIIPQIDYLQPVCRIRNITVGIGLVSLLVSYLAAMLIIMGITRPIEIIVEELQRVEAGSLDISLPQSGATPELLVLGNTINHMMEAIHYFIAKVREMVARLKKSSSQLAGQAGQVKDDSRRIVAEIKLISEEVNEQMDSLGKTRSLIQKLAGLVEKVLAANNTSLDVSRDIIQHSQRGQNAIERVKRETDRVCETTINTRYTFEHLNQQFAEINKINFSLETIAKQTKLLSLNAAIEAARAGEKGKSFSVVADEISKLSQMSQDFSQETSTLVNVVIKELNDLKITLDHMYQAVDSSSESVKDAGSVFDAIQEQIVKSNTVIEEASRATDDMFNLIKEVVGEMDIIYNDSQAIVSSIPGMLQFANNQAKNTGLMLEHSSYLDELAEELHQVTNCMGSSKL